MLRIWQKTEKQKLEPVGMGTAFPFLKEKNHVVSIIGGGGKTTLLYEMAGFCVKNDQKVLVTTSTHIYRPPKEWHATEQPTIPCCSINALVKCA